LFKKWKQQLKNAIAATLVALAATIAPGLIALADVQSALKKSTGRSKSFPGFYFLNPITIIMSLYTFSGKTSLPSIASIPGLTIKESNNVDMLSAMAGITPEEVGKRMSDDHLAFIAFMNNSPAAFGWMATGTAFIGELNHEMILPVRNRYLWNFRTLEQFRGRGIYPVLLQYIIRHEEKRADTFWIIHAPENKSSLKGIQKAGFEFAGKLYKRSGITTIESTAQSISLRQQLAEMDITISAKDPASCWNCSSPYLKKRSNECCCSKEGNDCIDNHLTSFSYFTN
jgi:GNAT superfamily N-acetyltransferase